MTVVSFLQSLMRRNAAPDHYQDWLAAEVARAETATDAAVLREALRHRNGFVREAACGRAAALLLPEALPDLAIRLNDWVPQVRHRASLAVKAYQAAGKSGAIVAALPDFHALRRCRRFDHAAYVDGIEAWVAAQADFKSRIERLPEAAPKVARRLFDIALRLKTHDIAALLMPALRCRDLVTAKRAALMTESLEPGARAKFLPQLLRSRNGAFRLAAMKAMPSDEARAQAWLFLLDPFTRLRAHCEKLLALQPEELKSLRRAALGDGAMPSAKRKTAIRLAGQEGDKAAEELILPYLGHARAAFQGAALLALCRLSPEVYEAKALAALTSPAAPLARAAVQAFLEQRYALSPEGWMKLGAAAADEACCRRLLALSRTRNKWDHLGLALQFFQAPAFAAVAETELKLWRQLFNRASIVMTPAQRDWIQANLALYKGVSPSAAEIAFYLR